MLVDLQVVHDCRPGLSVRSSKSRGFELRIMARRLYDCERAMVNTQPAELTEYAFLGAC